jgi:anti-sigma regulatory factor (Ser/Thr protein kinase)
MVVHLQAIVPACESTALQRAETALEELLTNSIVHGRSARLPEPVVWLAAHGNDGALHVRFEDACAAFDPIARIDDALRRTASPMDQRPAGGLGLLMVFRLADACAGLSRPSSKASTARAIGMSTPSDAARLTTARAQ